MFHGVLRTKESKIIIAVVALILLITGIFIFNHYNVKRKYEEQTVMAKEYLKAGSYEQAIDAYLRAMKMKNSNKELLSVGLAEAYIGVNNYDKALEVLRTSYKENSGKAIKEKIEEVTLKKTDYEFGQIINHADTYFYNKEYEKAITEYEKAKLIKSKESISYQRIAESYIAIENYELAREEVMEGFALTQSEELNQILNKVDSYLLKVQYDDVVTEASEYIYQENYEEAIKKYQEAVNLIPEEEAAYSGLAEAYITIGEYEKAVNSLDKILEASNDRQLRELYTKASSLLEEKKEREAVLLELYRAVSKANADKIVEIMNSTFFVDKIAVGAPVYYSTSGEGTIPSEEGMIIQDDKNIYYGGIKEGMKKGFGIHFMLLQSKEEQGWYYYIGEWNNGIPNGKGETKEELKVSKQSGQTYRSKVITKGNFVNGLEDGTMHKYYYTDGNETGDIRYSVKKGIPVPLLDEEGNEIVYEDMKQYAIGEIYLDGEPLGEYYIVDNNTVWGVRAYTKNKR